MLWWSRELYPLRLCPLGLLAHYSDLRSQGLVTMGGAVSREKKYQASRGYGTVLWGSPSSVPHFPPEVGEGDAE